MPMSLKATLKALLMNTSKKVALTEAAQVPGQNLLTNAQDLRTGLLDTVEEGEGTGIEAMMTVEVTDVVEEEALTSGMEEEEEEAVDTAEDVVEEEGTMTGGTIVVEGEVLYFNTVHIGTSEKFGYRLCCIRT